MQMWVTSVCGGRRASNVSMSVSRCCMQMTVFSGSDGLSIDCQRSAFRLKLVLRIASGKDDRLLSAVVKIDLSEIGLANTSSTVSTIASWHQHSSGQGGSHEAASLIFKITIKSLTATYEIKNFMKWLPPRMLQELHQSARLSFFTAFTEYCHWVGLRQWNWSSCTGFNGRIKPIRLLLSARKGTRQLTDVLAW